ncbi:TIR domain-containing protein [Candidatus Peregrinibacteria bacterium]|nr:TIR domain-containing protein [Candidatus Peregrinibacteria bacterium]
MSKKIFFSFHHKSDGHRVAQVRKSKTVTGYKMNPLFERSKWESIKRHGDHAVQDWINGELRETDVTVVLLGEQTGNKKWVNYEIQKSKEMGKGIIGIDISKMKDKNGYITEMGPSPLPAGTPIYSWTEDNGEENLDKWIEKASK